MNDRADGISSPQGGSGIAAPADHTKTCWAGALGQARRGRPPEDFEVSAVRALEMLAGDPQVCACRAQVKTRSSRRR
jgi:hypothetical protein